MKDRTMKKQYRPKLDPKVDLAGATPEALVRALFRRVEPLPPRPAGEPVGVDKPEVGQVESDAAAQDQKRG